MRPNFVVILTDDQGAWARGRTMPELQTPTLDALGADGLELTNFFCASPVCSPARASLLTGRMPSAHGVHDWIRSENSGIDTRGVDYLRDRATTPQVLAEGGYTCAHAGKWHLGDARHAAPGFDHWYAHRDGGGSYYEAPMVSGPIDRLIEVSERGYLTEAITNSALDMLKIIAKQDNPFYLQVHYTAPHDPWGAAEHPADLQALYADCDWPSLPPLLTPQTTHPWFDPAPWGILDAQVRHQSLVGLCASLTAVDHGVRAIVAMLEQLAVRHETYLVFMSDNGFNVGHHGLWGKGNGTYPLNMYDESIRVPFFINGPGVRPGLDGSLISAVQWHRTVLELAGIPTNDDPLNAGDSFVDLITGERPAREAIVMYDEYGGTRMIRTAHHKFVWRFGDAPNELYDLIEDPGESRNLNNDNGFRALAAELETGLRDWFAAHSDTLHDGAHRPVTGHGQDHPVWVDLPDESARYAQIRD